jgi:hypothetical protein
MLLLLVGAMHALVLRVHTVKASLAMCVNKALLSVYIPMRTHDAARHQLEHYHTHIRYVVCILTMYIRIYVRSCNYVHPCKYVLCFSERHKCSICGLACSAFNALLTSVTVLLHCCETLSNCSAFAAPLSRAAVTAVMCALDTNMYVIAVFLSVLCSGTVKVPTSSVCLKCSTTA